MIEILKATELGAKILLQIGELPVAISSITRFEYLLYFKSKKLQEEKKILTNLPVIEFTSKCADKAVEIYQHLKSKGKMINDRDILIAGSCIENNLVLVTLDKDFLRVPGLRVKKIL